MKDIKKNIKYDLTIKEKKINVYNIKNIKIVLNIQESFTLIS